jgi:hypothetical protein
LSAKNNFQEIIDEIRKDILFLKKDLFEELVKRILIDVDKEPKYTNDTFLKAFSTSESTRQWAMDVFLDKCFEIDAKIRKIVKQQLGCKMQFPIDLVKGKTESLIFQNYLRLSDLIVAYNNLNQTLEMYSSNIECQMSSIRFELHQTDWSNVRKFSSSDYVLPTKRATYISSRQELEKAKQAVKDKQWDEVLNHLRPAVDLAIKEKFGFTKIQPMKSFISDAEKFDLPLPSYTMIYDIFDEGSKRIHEGKLNTSYECQRALEFVAGFIDHLDLINMSQNEIDEFKSKCKFVE